MRPVAIFDTNILFSWLGWQGKPYQCVELARARIVTGDRRHLLPLVSFQGIAIVSAADFLTAVVP